MAKKTPIAAQGQSRQSARAFDRSIDVRIARIRRKIERDPGKPQVIKTVRGAGYIYVPGKS